MHSIEPSFIVLDILKNLFTGKTRFNKTNCLLHYTLESPKRINYSEKKQFSTIITHCVAKGGNRVVYLERALWQHTAWDRSNAKRPRAGCTKHTSVIEINAVISSELAFRILTTCFMGDETRNNIKEELVRFSQDG